jgi:hypothetical protein
MLMARVKTVTIAEYCSKDALIATPQFTDYMSQDRFLLLLRLLHFNDNETQVHTLWLDSWYSGPLLYNWLHNNGTNACGTVRKNRKGLPKLDKKLGKEQIASRCTDIMMVVNWKDK